MHLSGEKAIMALSPHSIKLKKKQHKVNAYDHVGSPLRLAGAAIPAGYAAIFIYTILESEARYPEAYQARDISKSHHPCRVVCRGFCPKP